MSLEQKMRGLSLGPRRKTVPKSLKDRLWDVTFGERAGVGECYVCGTMIHARRFEAGHVVAVVRGGDTTLDNLRCICAVCNRSMRDEHLEVYKQRYHPPVKYPCYVCKKETKQGDYYGCCQVNLHKDCLTLFYDKEVNRVGRRAVFLRTSNCPSCFSKN